MNTAPWDAFLTDQDRAVFAAGGYGRRAELGERPALLVIDVTYGFCGDRPEPILESVKRWRSSCGERAWEALPHVGRLIETAHRRDVPVVYTRGAPRRADGFDRGRWADKNARQAADTPRVDEFVAEIAPQERDLVIEKRKPSAFFGTTLISHLVSLRVDTLVVCGTTTSGCVRATVTDAFSYDYRVAVATEATFDRGEASHAMALFDLDMKYANVTPVEQIIGYFDALR
ncbi:isochorismatase family protein [Actinomadura sp.]|jgi:nicotinamidase-related amidase|uniref:isochorismatase family protein n=1 Tax=Actinomadura sp. TaxID=1989 RepID=UPI0037CBF986